LYFGLLNNNFVRLSVYKSEICIPVKKFIASISIFGLSVLLVSFTGTDAGNAAKSIFSFQRRIIDPANLTTDISSSLYSLLRLEEKGLSRQAFDYAYKGYRRLVEKKKIKNTCLLTICDFSQSSRNKRLYIVDLSTNEVVMNTYVAHGKNSGTEFATRFSNRPESLQSSLGFYITGQTYNGQHGLSLRMEGLEPGINDKAYQRAIVVHGADYIGNGRLNGNAYMGRSFGCPAVPEEESAEVINMIKDGSCLFIYHPAQNYLRSSKILNG
jgi:hypothetical protein